jgi:S1-C subfamily serine protease
MFSQFPKSIVQIKANHSNPNALQPWSSTITQTSSTGFVIEGNDSQKLVVTNAHCVNNAKYIQVKFATEGDLYDARVEKFAGVCDLALLVVESEEFNNNAIPLNFAKEQPKQGADISVHGFPNGADYSVVDGKLGRMDVSRYAFSKASFLELMITAQIKNGNSGGPLLYQNEVIGIVSSAETGGFGYAIPLPIIKHFLESGGNFPEISVNVQKMENSNFREAYKLTPKQSGVLVTDVDRFSSAFGILNTDDILLTVDGFKISNQGMIEHPVSSIPIFYTHAIHMHRLGEKVKFTILRNGEEQEVIVRLNQIAEKTSLLPMKYNEQESDYYHVGGLIIRPFTRNYIFFLIENNGVAQQNSLRAKANEFSDLKDHKKTEKIRKYLFISKVLPGAQTQSLQAFEGSIIHSVNGIEVGNMREMILAFEKNNDKFHKIITRGTSKNEIIIAANLSKEEENKLLDTYQVPAKQSHSVLNKMKLFQRRDGESIKKEENNNSQTRRPSTGM